jgi:thiol-disulfide isomerase/thioredoxin
MKTICLFLVLIFATPALRPIADNDKPVEQPAVILKTFDNFLTYYGRYINLEIEFTALDESAKPISKDAFLKKLTTGVYLPLCLQSKAAVPVYELYKIDAEKNPRVVECLRGWAVDYYSQYSKMGKPFPQFSFTDMDGKTYNNENTKGKILVLKNWGLTCPPCIKEIPQLNKMVAKYRNRKDIVFVSVVPETETQVKPFLAQHPFSYPVVPRERYFLNVLQLNFAPCHVIVNKEGRVTLITSSPDILAAELAKEAKI